MSKKEKDVLNQTVFEKISHKEFNEASRSSEKKSNLNIHLKGKK